MATVTVQVLGSGVHLPSERMSLQDALKFRCKKEKEWTQDGYLPMRGSGIYRKGRNHWRSVQIQYEMEEP